MDTSHPVRVEFEDVDMYGVVHHPRYLHFMERARVSLLHRLGFDRASLDGGAAGLVVREISLRYRQPARFGDELVVELLVEKVGAASCSLVNPIRRRDGTLLATGRVSLVYVDSAGKPIRFSRELREALLGLVSAASD